MSGRRSPGGSPHRPCARRARRGHPSHRRTAGQVDRNAPSAPRLLPLSAMNAVPRKFSAPPRTYAALLVLWLGLPTLSRAAGVNFSWNDCGASGTALATFACNTNTGIHSAVASFVPPDGVQELMGVEADVRIESSESSLPDWWRHGTGECRGTTGLSTSFDFTGGPFSCVDFYAGQASGGFSYQIGAYGANTAKLHVSCAVPSASRGPVDPASEYYAFKVNLLRA